MDLSKISGMAEAPAVVLATELDYRSAWERVLEKAGMPGVDGVTTSRFKRLADGCFERPGVEFSKWSVPAATVTNGAA